jgi:hypothetical protein
MLLFVVHRDSTETCALICGYPYTAQFEAIAIITAGQCSAAREAGLDAVWSVVRMCCMGMHLTPAVSRVTVCQVGAHSVCPTGRAAGQSVSVAPLAAWFWLLFHPHWWLASLSLEELIVPTILLLLPSFPRGSGAVRVAGLECGHGCAVVSMHWTPAVSRVTGRPVGAHSVKGSCCRF